ncbi:MAG: hypothetical protein FJ316_01585 [SAR202 cluster bacterium]|nr:hypothetical protein [SAR202 cluster bacterium]
MASDVLREYVSQARPDVDSEIQELATQRLLDVLQPLMFAKNNRQFHSIVEKVVLDYVPVLEIIFRPIASELLREGKFDQARINLVQQVLNASESNAVEFFSSSDRWILLEVFQMQTRLNRVLQQAPVDSRAAVIGSVMDSYWANTKLDLCVLAVRLILSGELVPQNKMIPHWLCLAMKHYLNKCQSAWFANDPVLQARLRSPAKTISHEEMKRRLGL